MPAMSPLNTFTDGQLVNAAALNTIGTNINSLALQTTGKATSSAAVRKPILYVSQTATRSIANNTTTAIPWDTAAVNSDNMWTSGQTITVRTPGWYDITLQVVFASGSAGLRAALIFLNGTAYPTNLATETDRQMGASNAMHLQAHLLERINTGVTITAGIYQNSGGSLSTSLSRGGVWMSCAWKGAYS